MLPALPFVLNLVAPIVISVVMDRLTKFQKDTNWTQLKIDTDRKVRSVVPGDMFDDATVMFVNRQIDNVQAALRDTAVEQKVLHLLAHAKWAEAGAEIVKYAFPDVKVAS